MRNYRLLSFIILAVIQFAFCSLSHAHFIYVYSHDGKAKVVFGEDLEPDQAKFLAGLSSMKAYKIENGKRVPIELTQKTEDGTGWFETSLSASEHMVDVHCPYGVFGRGDKKMLLDYSAKYINLNAGKPAIADSLLPLDLIPIMKNGRLEVTGYFDGKPSENIEIEVTRMAGESIAKTNASGQAVLNLDARYVVRGKFSVGETGELNGKTFTEKRYYCTLVIDTEPLQQKSADLTTATKTSLKKVDAKLADFPKGMTSFGATVVGNQIFVVGGKSGRAHHYARSFQNRDVFCLPVDGSQKKWRSVGENLGLQGLSIVGHKGKVYRIGGLEAKNKEGDEQDLHSTASFVEFDPATKTWRKLPDLPEGRSSIDACVAGNNIYVAGGWNMGEGKPRWATKMLRFDLSKPHGSWQQIESPFKSRAMALRHHNGKLFAIGGIQQAGGPTNKVHIYDLATDEWSNGPAIPTSGPMKAFGCSAVSINGQLLVSTYDGGIFALSNDGKDWAKVHELDAGRFFHQMLPITDNRFALVGGSHMETGSHLEVEVFEVTENMTDASTK